MVMTKKPTSIPCYNEATSIERILKINEPFTVVLLSPFILLEGNTILTFKTLEKPIIL
jgi:hypothetical protein